jgi:hypothetical protein
MSEAETQAKKPVKTFRAGGVEASIWENKTQEGDREVTRHSIRIHKQYKDKEGNFAKTDYFFPNQLPLLSLVAAKAYEWVMLRTSDDREIPV